MEGLNPKIVEKIHDRENVPTTIEDWKKLAATYDQNYRRGKAIASRLRGQSDTKKKDKGRRFAPRYVPPARDPNAMDVDRLSIEAQKDYMQKGLCFRCGNQGHISRDCPRRPSLSYNRNRPSNQNPRTSNPNPTPRTGKEVAAHIRAMVQELPEEEREITYTDLESEGF
ncbi:hypothetical protein PQX77_015302 [Marasmius sp. AFHP31]|nr:hypothetical protein PQX77_015302 [Marasmius sp. AFHP31]